MNKSEMFKKEVEQNISKMGEDKEIKNITNSWMKKSIEHNYSYNFSWMGRPIIQYPQDIVAMQELIWRVQPDLIVETGIAHGGSLIFYASMLELLGGDRKVLGVDIDIREHNRSEIENHSMFKRIKMIQGSSIDLEIVKEVKGEAEKYNKILLVLDSNHTHEHVLKELELYQDLVRKGSYIVVFDTVVEDLPNEYFDNRPWGQGDNPKTAVLDFLKQNDRFIIDKEVEDKLLITVAPSGYLKCIK